MLPHRLSSAYAELLAGQRSRPWWTAVAITASSARQAERYREEIERRRKDGTIPAGVAYLAVPDPNDQRVGSGGATLEVLRVLGAQATAEWWLQQRVLIIHSGGDSRRLPQYSLSGKLFSALPLATPWGGVSTVFDETLIRSTGWVERMPAGFLVGSGDVILTFDAGALRWDRPGVTGVAIRQPMDVARQHGVYVADDTGRVYSFLQKPSEAQVRAAGGLPDSGEAAVER